MVLVTSVKTVQSVGVKKGDKDTSISDPKSPIILDEAAADDTGEVVEISVDDCQIQTPPKKRKANKAVDEDEVKLIKVKVNDVFEIKAKDYQSSIEKKPVKDILYKPVLHGVTGDSFISTIASQILSWKPRVVYFPGFASAKECRDMIKMAKEKGLAPSQVGLVNGQNVGTTSGIRTSSGTFITASSDKTGTLDLIEQKIARATMIPRNHGEAFNVLKYEIGQKYSPHYDTFKQLGNGPMIYPAAFTTPQMNERVATFLLYLSDVEEGGETVFPLENQNNYNQYGYKQNGYNPEIFTGLKVKPRKGDALLFYTLSPNNTIEKASLHGSAPVIKGEKWVATKWMRTTQQH